MRQYNSYTEFGSCSKSFIRLYLKDLELRLFLVSFDLAGVGNIPLNLRSSVRVEMQTLSRVFNNFSEPIIVVNPGENPAQKVFCSFLLPLQRPENVWSSCPVMLPCWWTQSWSWLVPWIIPQMFSSSKEHWSKKVWVEAGKKYTHGHLRVS